MQALAAYDLVGFQTEALLQAFFGCVRTLASGRQFGGGQFVAGGFGSRAAVFPVGIDTDAFTGAAEEAAKSAECAGYRRALPVAA